MTEEWIYCEELINKGFPEGKILDFLRKGLKPYNENGQRVFCPILFHKYLHYWNLLASKYPGFKGYGDFVEKNKKGESIPPNVLKLIRKRAEIDAEIEKICIAEPNLEGNQKKLSWNFVWAPPEDTTDRKELFKILGKTKFNEEEFEKLFEKNPPSFAEESSVQSRIKRTKSTKSENQDYSFIFQGGGWLVTYDGKTKQLKNNERIKYIAYLLDNPNYEYESWELWGVVKGTLDNQILPPIRELTEEDEENYRNILKDLFREIQEIIKQNDSLEFKNAERDYKIIKTFLEKNHGAIITEKNNTVRVEFKGDGQYKKTIHSDAVKKQIKEARKQISKEGLPELAEHLKTHVKKLEYRPPIGHPEWYVVL